MRRCEYPESREFFAESPHNFLYYTYVSVKTVSVKKREFLMDLEK